MGQDNAREECRPLSILGVFRIQRYAYAVITDAPIRIVCISEAIFKFLRDLGVCEFEICD